MSSSGDIESAMQRRIAEEQGRKEAEERQLAKRIAAGAEPARGFVELMRKHRVTPETVYWHQQVRLPGGSRWYSRPDKTFERFEPVDQGWVVQYSMTEYSEPWMIKYLRPDGLINDCDVRGLSNGFPNEGLIEAPTRTAFGAGWALCSKVLRPPPGNPFLTVDDYAVAARRYLS
ncbi:MAG: hypothetical protein JWL58_7237 [Streptosporangiaceae bacterium]|nr:hypothetical protein [Streptosporangiaceae bacterium]